MYFDDKGKGRLKVESKCNHLLLGCIDQKKKTTFGFIDIYCYPKLDVANHRNASL